MPTNEIWLRKQGDIFVVQDGAPADEHIRSDGTEPDVDRPFVTDGSRVFIHRDEVTDAAMLGYLFPGIDERFLPRGHRRMPDDILTEMPF